MKFGKRNKSIVDALFLLALFSVFLICALFIVLFGAKIYKNIVAESEISFSERTSASYITEKMRQNDNIEGACIINDAAAPVLRISKKIDDNVYYTYLYCENGYLNEYTNAEPQFDSRYGSQVMEMKKMDISEISDTLYKFELTDANDRNIQFFVSRQVSKGGSDE